MDPFIKLNRAKLRLGELQISLDKYFSIDPYKVAVRINSKKCPEHYLAGVIPVPIEVTLLASEVIQNLRSSLDHLVYKAFRFNNFNHEGKHIQFPIADTEDEYNKIKNLRLRGLTEEFKYKIDKYKPFKEGNLLLWQLNRLNNIDKHRLLVTVGSKNGGVDIMPTLLDTMSSVLDTVKMNELKKQMKPLFIQPSSQTPVKVGDVLFTDLPGKSMSQLTFQFFVTLYEPSVIEGTEIMATLGTMCNKVSDIIEDIEKLPIG